MHTTGERQTEPGFLDFGSFLELREAAAQQHTGADLEALHRIATRHPPATFFGPDGETRRGPDRVLEAYEHATQFVIDGNTHFEMFQSAASDGLGYWVGLQRVTVDVADGQAPRHVVLRVTELFRRERGEWKLIHRHADELESTR